jgi:hypothetical protein
MKISDTEILQMIVQSWFAARGENFDEISCPKLQTFWNEIMKTPTNKNAVTWVHHNCKFAAHQKEAGWMQNLISNINPAQLNQLKNMVMTNIEQAKQFALQLANKLPGGAQNACQIANILIGEAGNFPPGLDPLPCHLASKTAAMPEKRVPFKAGDRVLVNYNKQRQPGTVLRQDQEWVIVKIDDWTSKGNSFSPQNVSLMTNEQLP